MSETSSPDPGGPGSPGSSPTPGEVRPRRTLERPPSARFQADQGAASEEAGAGAGTGGAGAQGSGRALTTGGLRTAIGIAILGAVAIAALNAVLAVTTGLVAVAGVTGYLIGLALRPGSMVDALGGRTPGVSTGANRVSLAIELALLAVAAGAAGAWLVAIPQGNLLGPIDYLGQTLGILLPVQAVAAVVGAWLGSR
jgi:hypothetical protein